MRTVIVTAILSLLAAPTMGESRGIGWWGDGNGCYAEYRGPTSFDGESGKNIAWKAQTLNWSNSSPIIVGTKLFYLNEPIDWRPILVCLDARNGRELWRRKIDVLQALPPAQRAQMADAVPAAWAWLWKKQTLRNKFLLAGRKADGELEKQMLEIGFTKHPRKGHMRLDKTREPAVVEKVKEAGLGWDRWTDDGCGTWVGIAYGTPVSDGKRVYIQTSNNLFCAVDMDGNMVWQQRFAPVTRKSQIKSLPRHYQDFLDGTRWKGGVPGAGNFSTSPILYGDLLLSCGGRWLRAFDTRTGAVRWQWPQYCSIGQNMGVPNIVEVDGTAILIAPGKSRKGSEMRRVRDGHLMGWLPGATANKGGLFGALVSGNRVVTRGKNQSLMVFELSLEKGGDAVTARKVADLPTGSRRSVLCEDRLYYRDRVFSLDGRQLAEELPDTYDHTYFRSNLVVGPYFLSLAQGKGVYLFRDRRTGRKVGEGRLPVNPPSALGRDLRLAQGNFAKSFGSRNYNKDLQVEKDLPWMIVGGAFPCATRDRLYFRSFDYVWCIGR